MRFLRCRRDRHPSVRLVLSDGGRLIELPKDATSSEVVAVAEWLRGLAREASERSTVDVVAIRAPLGGRPSVDLRVPGQGVCTFLVGDSLQTRLNLDLSEDRS